ncbi:MAG: hypothetical protein WBI63_00575 [Coriobacteriia bacterium]
MAADEVKAGKSKVVVALLMVLIVFGVLAAAYAFLGGADLVADLMGDSEAEPTTPSTPATPAAPSTPSTATASGDTTESTEPAASTDETATASGTSGAASTSGGSSAGTTKPAVNPPTGDQAARMYWEQVASQEQIGKLVRGEISRIQLGAVTQSGTTANVRVTVYYTAGGSLSGTMVLRNYSGVWYFSSIARDGNSLAVKTGASGDTGVVSTIVSQQAANQEIVAGIINGGYTSVKINGFSGGSGTQTLNITVSGGTAPATAGSIVCVSKTISGTKHWFITSFSKN